MDGIRCVSRPSRVGDLVRHKAYDTDISFSACRPSKERDERIKILAAQVAANDPQQRDPIRVFKLARGQHRGKWAVKLGDWKPGVYMGPYLSASIARKIGEHVLASGGDEPKECQNLRWPYERRREARKNLAG